MIDEARCGIDYETADATLLNEWDCCKKSRAIVSKQFSSLPADLQNLFVKDFMRARMICVITELTATGGGTAPPIT